MAAGDLPDGHAARGVIADDAAQSGLAGCLGFPGRQRAVRPAAARWEPGEGVGERGDGAAAGRGEPSHADRAGGDAGVADVDLQQARAQVVGAGQAPDIGLGGFPGGRPDADRERRERPVIRRHVLFRGRRLPVSAASDASTPMESRLVRVIFSVPSRTAWIAAPRMRRSGLPIAAGAGQEPGALDVDAGVVLLTELPESFSQFR